MNTNSNPTSATLISCVGSSDYLPVHYRLSPSQNHDEDITTNQWQKYFVVALIELLSKQPSSIGKVILLETPQVTTNANAIEQEIAQRNLCREVVRVPIPAGQTEADLWTVFNTLSASINDGERVVLDITHAFRSLPVTVNLAMSFLHHARNIDVCGMYYGAFEAVGGPSASPSAMKIRAQELRNAGREHDAELTAPVFNLTPMYNLTHWASALTEWKNTGRAVGLVKNAQKHTNQFAQLGERSKLTALPAQLQLLDDALALVRLDQFASTGQVVAAASAEAAMQTAKYPALAPFRMVLEQLPKTMPAAAAMVAEEPWATLKLQLAVAKWFLTKQRFPEALTVLREVMTSLATAVSGRELSCDQVARELYEATVVGVGKFRGTDTKTPTTPDLRTAEIVAELFSKHPKVLGEWSPLYNKLTILRNNIDHGWTGKDAGKFSNGSMKSFSQAAILFADQLELLVESVRVHLPTLKANQE